MPHQSEKGKKGSFREGFLFCFERWKPKHVNMYENGKREPENGRLSFSEIKGGKKGGEKSDRSRQTKMTDP